MKRYFFKVIPKGDEWIVKMDGTTVNIYSTRELALDHARVLASENRPSILLVRQGDGSLEFAEQYEKAVYSAV